MQVLLFRQDGLGSRAMTELVMHWLVQKMLPTVLQEAFGERDVEALKSALATLDVEDAQYHMQRCIDSGLWDPAGGGGGSSDDA